MKMGNNENDEAGLGLLVDVRGAGRVFVERLQPKCSAERSNLVGFPLSMMYPSGHLIRTRKLLWC
jgi:hypothetical protein